MFTVARHVATNARNHALWAASLGLAQILPRPLLNNLTALNIGRLSTTNRLRMRTVPEITVDDITKAMQDEAR